MDAQRMAYGEVIGDWITKIDSSNLSSKDKKKKILELHHLASLFISMKEAKFINEVNEFGIIELSEGPDALVTFNQETIGLEFTQLISDKGEAIGRQKGLLRKTESMLTKKYPDLKVLVNICFNERFLWGNADLKEMKDDLCSYIYAESQGIQAIKPAFVESLRIGLHSMLSINLSGAYWVPTLPLEKIIYEIQTKEDKLSSYRVKYPSIGMWLILTFGGASPESDYRSIDTTSLNIVSNFDRIFMINDFKKKLYILK
jgi:hypothetical protein